MTGPLCIISVIIVCRNSRDGLNKTLRSVQALNDSRVRLIVIDGQSTDGSKQDLEAWRSKLFCLVSEPDGGIYSAMNKGWRAAEDESYILYLGAGDLLHELPPSKEFSQLNGSFVSVIMGKCFVGPKLFKSQWDWRMRFHNTAHHQALLIRKSVRPTPPFDETLKVFGDWDFNLALFRSGVQAKQSMNFCSYAEPGGVSARPDLAEVQMVARKHSGSLAGWVAWARFRAFFILRRLRQRA